VPSSDIKLECVCTHKREMGKLLVTDQYTHFRSLHHDKKIPFHENLTIKRKGNTKIRFIHDGDILDFGPFDAIRRGDVLKVIEGIHKNLPANEGDGEAGGIDLKNIDGLEDEITKAIFDEPVTSGEVPYDKFGEIDDKYTVCIDETYPIALKPLFALILSDSTSFLKDLHVKEGDSDLVLNKWALDDSKQFHHRLFDFVKRSKLVNCTVHQSQYVRLVTPTDLRVHTSNKMEGVPFADCFTVDTKWKITEEDEKCRIQVLVKVNFTKSVSLVRGKIERNSVQGTVDYFKSLARFLRSKFRGAAGVAGDAEAEALDEPTAGKSGLSPVLAITLGVGCALFFVLWLWYWWSAGSWAAYVVELETRNVELELLVEELLQARPAPPEELQETMKQWSNNIGEAMSLLEKVKTELDKYDSSTLDYMINKVAEIGMPKDESTSLEALENSTDLV